MYSCTGTTVSIHEDDDVTIFVIVSPRLAESYRTWWHMMWDLLPEPKKSGRKKS
jgi:hypothetical protein